MIPDTAIALEYAPNAPCAVERAIFNLDTKAALIRILSRLGVAPLNIAFRVRDDETLIVGRNAAGQEAIWGRIMFGATLNELRQARDDLLAAGWRPTPAKFDMTLPDGRQV